MRYAKLCGIRGGDEIHTILGIIPARGGSKGIPYKNIKTLAGKPLITWTIERAKESKMLDKVVVSTEDKKIKEISIKYGAEVIDRPKKLAQDDSTSLDVIIHAIKALLPDFVPDIVVLLQPTSPIRNKGLVDACIQKFIESKADSLVTGFNCKYVPYGLDNDKRRQDRKGFFTPDGNVYVIRSDLLLKGDFFGKKIQYVYISREENVDIDEPFDFWLAEKILEWGNKKLALTNKKR